MEACPNLQGIASNMASKSVSLSLFNESLITRARNYLVDEFIRSGYTHLLFIDSDILYDPQTFSPFLALE
jgi:hypothetical protein